MFLFERMKIKSYQKLVLNFYNKENYVVVAITTLKQTLNHGLIF